MDNDFIDALELAKNLLRQSRHAAMATVNEDGSPHNTPFFFQYDEKLKNIYWGSFPDSLHSRNIDRTGEVFIAIYDSVQPKKGGIYIRANCDGPLDGESLETAVRIHNEFRSNDSKAPLPIEYYSKGNPQQMYSAKPVQCWILMNENDENGLRIKDYRKEISISDLI